MPVKNSLARRGWRGGGLPISWSEEETPTPLQPKGLLACEALRHLLSREQVVGTVGQ